MVSYVKHDLDFILAQIKIAEQNATTEDANGNPVAGTPLSELIDNPLLPYGLRTVDGRNNNIIPGREDWGAADELFPRLTDPDYRNEQDGETFDPDGPGPAGPITNTDYGAPGSVVDGNPRTISNLIVDQTLNNPAAIQAALKYAEMTGSITHEQSLAGQAAILAVYDTVKDALAAVQSAQAAQTAATAALASANAALAAAQAGNPGLGATIAAYQAAIDATAETVTAAQQAALTASALATELVVGGVDANDAGALAAAVNALTALHDAATAILTALQSDVNVQAADISSAQAFISTVESLQGAIGLINTADGVTALEDNFANLVATTAQQLIADAGDLQAQLTDSQEAVPSSDPAIAAALAAVAAAQTDLAEAQTDLAEATTAAAEGQVALDEVLAEYSVEITGNGSLVIPNIAPDEGISAPFNSWMTLFGQFFDHGLDLVTKGGNGTVFIPLQPDDPLYVEGGNSNFMVLTRTTPFAGPGADGIVGTADDTVEQRNTTTSFVDQNQTYTSHASHQVFLREYVLDANGNPVATGHLLAGENGGLATWADIKAQAREMLGINLTDADVGNVPLLATDEYGRFLRGPEGFAQVVVRTAGADGIAGNADDTTILVEGDPTANGGLGINLTPADLGGTVVRTGHAFLDDIAHTAVPVVVGGVLQADADDIAGNAVPVGPGGNNLQYDNELLDAHYVAGDGRANENFGLTAVHHVFHSEHNRLVEHTKDVVIQSGDLSFINEWLATPITIDQIPTTAEGIDALDWNGERLFQAARFGTEMQYQHLVFEEFARKVNPAVDLFVFNPTMDVNPSIFAEFAHVVYRFGHSMLTETVDRTGFDGQTSDDVGLIEAFLNPLGFDQFNGGTLTADQAAGAIIRGMTSQTGNEIDEFVTDALRNNLLGLPLDLATINMTRAREAGVPSLNEAREQFYEMTRSEWLQPYTGWVDFAQHLKNPASIINFIAAYGTHETITSATTLEAKRDAATLLVLGGTGAPADRLDFLNGTGAYNNEDLGGLNNVDLWIGGLAEAILPFGGMLGSTFTFVFEMQMENLQNGDRLYYLSRTQGLHFITELEANTFAHLVQLNTDLGEEGTTHLPGQLFDSMDYIFEVNQAVQVDYNPDDATSKDPDHDDPVLAALEDKVARGTNVTIDGNVYQNLLKFTGGEHVVLGGTEQSDALIGDLGDDTFWGDGGDDYINGGHGVNHLHGGAGDDIILDGGDISFIHGEEGNDAISGGAGLGELIFAGDGDDFVIAGIDGKEVFAGLGNDWVFGSPDVDNLIGGEGDDWIEGGEGFDTISGENSELFFNSTIIGHDVMFAGTNEQDFDAESGDDIMVQGESVMRNEGMFGFDWATFQDMQLDAYADMRIPIFTTVEADILRNRFDRTEALSGWENDDTLIGDDRIAGDGIFDPGVPPGEGDFDGDGLDRAGVERISGLRDVLGLTAAELAAFAATDIVFDDGNILLGGGGSDTIQGNGGDDIIDGDKWLSVRIGIFDGNTEIGTASRMQSDVVIHPAFLATFGALNGVSLDELIFTRQLNTSDLRIMREVLDGGQAGDVDIAVFRGLRQEYDITENADGTWTVAHTRAAPNGGAVTDATDTLRNIEVLQFADGIEIIGDIANSPATGQLILLDSTPGTPAAVGDTFTVDISAIVDANGVPPLSGFTITWQVEQTPGVGDWVTIEDPVADDVVPNGPTFTPTTAMELEGLRIRAIATFIDGHGIPEVVVSAPTVALAAQAATVATTGDDILFGTAGADVIDALAGDDEVFGFAGNDTLIGGPGADLLDGGEGADTLNGGAGDDDLLGGAGADTLNGGAGSDILDGGAGNDTAVFQGNLADFTFEVTPTGTLELVQGANEDEIIDIENLTFNDASITLAAAQDLAGAIRLGAATTFEGGAAAEFVIGDGANETINGNGGADTLFGNGGQDTLNGGAGADVLLGGAGADELNGDAGADFLNGEGGADTLNGGAGADTLLGGDGIDELFGNAGADTLDGGAGNDELTGGAGVDTFVFSGVFGTDMILDLDDAGGGQDILDLTAFDMAFENLIIVNGTDGAEITVGTFGTIVVAGVTANNLGADDFVF
ncbi:MULTISPECIES: peroxidase family protein [Rhodomicrobium]|uniref:peroxidase family protein n=1 Tax=Rhodomicrobium TaxID=1068 RepID=UPI000B4BFD17|nr:MULTISPECIES: peroxidase family protein [Rhodomicrobium]